MGKIKHTKNELKAQRDALQRFERYLPTLLLKKQQLQVELRNLESLAEKKRKEDEQVCQYLKSWIKLFSEPIKPENYIQLKSVRMTDGNIAGVTIPLLEGIKFDKKIPDFFETPTWLDDGLSVLEKRIGARAELTILEEQIRRVKNELRVTSQRVNLFEKIKIPECREHIRMIRIFLGDQLTAGVARSKMTKSKSAAKASSL